ncbi:hypothetical protein [Arthrobacter sp. H5]|uniref:hypothetical protein n=1 Tax=Arthrobacter sp. H5 TaxID=1267973 RepID=UPI0004AF2D44|nr:hypothetical protein [Arthrobacter sp. H5]
MALVALVVSAVVLPLENSRWEAGYPYVISGFPLPYVHAGGEFSDREMTCGGQSMPVIEISVEPESTLLKF